jgi:ribosomal protein S18 acetylase RimI-like enzyme
MDHVLDNPVWHALIGPHAAFAIGSGRARHYPRDIVPFSAVAEPTPAAYRDLAVDLPPNTEARLQRLRDEPIPSRWDKVSAYPLLQMVADRIEGAVVTDAPTVVSLDERDIEAMLELMAATNPGRFGPRTPMLGAYLGIRDGERLIAMAGERIRVPGYVELSAISTHPQARRRGHARHLTTLLMRRALDRGERPFLHLRSTNTAALSVYTALGFKVRRELVSIWCKPTTSRS